MKLPRPWATVADRSFERNGFLWISLLFGDQLKVLEESQIFISLRDMKVLLHLALGLLGLILILVSFLCYNSDLAALDPFSSKVVSFVLFFAGVADIVFCCEAYLLRGENDIWQ